MTPRGSSDHSTPPSRQNDHSRRFRFTPNDEEGEATKPPLCGVGQGHKGAARRGGEPL